MRVFDPEICLVCSPLRPQYTAHQSAPISHMLFKHPHSPYNIQAEDIFMLVDTTQRLRNYVQANDNSFKMFMQLMGQHYETSPSQRKSEIPTMIIGQVQSIFMRRIRRLKKLQKEEHSSRDSSGTDISFSKSYKPNNNSGRYLQSRLSQKSISQMTEFRGSYYEGSDFDIYHPITDSDMESQLNAFRRKAQEQFNSWLLMSGIRRTAPIEEKDTGLIEALKQTGESEVEHLIMGSVNKKQQKVKKQQITDGAQLQVERQVKKKDRYQHLVSPLPYLLERDLPLHIKKEVYRQLCKYSWLGVTPRVDGSKRKVRDKAQQLLMAMRN